MTQNNYEKMRDQIRPYFLTFDQEEMIRKFNLKHDDQYLYIRFCNRMYRIHRKNGIVEWSDNQFMTYTVGNYNESLTIYDILCYSKPNCCLSGKYAPSSSLKGVGYTGMNAGSFSGTRNLEKYFNNHVKELEQACLAFGGIPEGKGDLAYQIPLFDFLPIRFAFWQADDEFPAEIQVLWDCNVLHYMHFETLFLAAGHLLHRMKEWIDEY